MSISPSFLFRESPQFCKAAAWRFREHAELPRYVVECDCRDALVAAWGPPTSAVVQSAESARVEMIEYRFNFVGKLNQARVLGPVARRVALYVQAGKCSACGVVHWACCDLADLVRISEVPVIVLQRTYDTFEVRSGT